jgi:hypothetical protein
MLSPVLVVVAAMVSTTTSSGPRRCRVMSYF